MVTFSYRIKSTLSLDCCRLPSLYFGPFVQHLVFSAIMSLSMEIVSAFCVKCDKLMLSGNCDTVL